MDFFSNCKNNDQAKSTFRLLSLMFHPDKAGNNDLMIELNKQYISFKSGTSPLFDHNGFKEGKYIHGNLNSIKKDIPLNHPIYAQLKFLQQENIRLTNLNNKMQTDHEESNRDLINLVHNYESKFKYMENKYDEGRLKNQKLETDLNHVYDELENTPKTLWEFIKRAIK